MIFYVVNLEDAGEHEQAFETLRAASKTAKNEAEATLGCNTVTRVDTGKLSGRALAVAIFNREGYAYEHELVRTYDYTKGTVDNVE